jgi:uncharacterized protein (DUF1800 family)
MNQQEKIQHLLSRASFGARYEDLKRLQKLSLKSVLDSLFEDSATIEEIILVEGKSPKASEIMATTKQEKKELLGKSRMLLKQLNVKWLEHIAQTKAQLREKMTLFWHGHFACQPKSIYTAQVQINTLRKLALGKFGDLVMYIAKDPAMIAFLNNQQNRKRKPNENFARELMELFTLGRGNYTEKDIKESARAFTGWSFDGDEYIFRSFHHDFDEKTFLGKSGNFNGEDIIQIILQKPETARFIVGKIYRFLVNEEEPNPQIINSLAERFFASNYDISALLKDIFMSDWFYDPKNVGNHIKSPIEYIVGLQRQLGLKFTQEQSPIFVQKVLGQMLLYPPNVAGWKGGRAWIDSSTLLFRLQFPYGIYKATEISIQAKEEEDVQKKDLVNQNLRRYQAEYDWRELDKNFGMYRDTNTLIEDLANYLLQTPSKALKKWKDDISTKPISTELIHEVAVMIASLPEYQLC